jgi:hypothetical protein
VIDPEFKEKWIKALEKDYKKGTSRLRIDDDHFCCLGVACDLIDPSRWNVVSTISGKWRFDRDGAFIPTIYAYKIGLTLRQQGELVNLNDTHETWGPVIDYIRENL